MLCEGVIWLDDWFAVEEVAPGVIAIGEPRFHQINWNYLILGTRRALMLDTGPGVRDISKAVRSLTTLPVTALPSAVSATSRSPILPCSAPACRMAG